MASYGNDLRLKEITTGDETGTWGTSTNTNLGLIADAFGYGTKQMAADANETFTIPDGTADGSRALYLKITSAVSLTASRTITLGPNTVSKMWFVGNATTGTQSIVISQGSGGTVTIPNGSTAVIYTDGAGSGAAVIQVPVGEVTLTTAQTLANKTLTAYRETIISTTIAGTTHNIDLSTSNVFKFTLQNNVTFTFTNPPVAGILASATIILIQDGVGGRTATFTGAQYTDGALPSLSTGAGQKDVLTFFTVDSGVPYYGTFAMANVS
jgi:hypothetical protein